MKEDPVRSSSNVGVIIPATLIKEYFFCPRIPYIVLNTSHVQREYHFMTKGREIERKLAEEAIEKLNAKIVAEKVEGTHRTLRIYGVVDYIVECDKSLHVLEVKNSTYRDFLLGHKFQALAYLLIARDCNYLVRSTVIYYGVSKTFIEVFPTQENLRLLQQVVNSIRRSLRVGMPVSKSDKCGVCSYSHICMKL